MLEWALATFVKSMKIRLRKNRLSILAEREVPQSRNCLWCDELMINYDGYGLCCVWRGLCNQECMNEWACITFCNRARRLGVAGVNSPPPIFLPFFSSSSACQLSHVRWWWIPLPHYATTNFGREMYPPPPPPPLSVVFRAGAMPSETFCQDCGSVVMLALLTWCGVVWYAGSGVASCSVAEVTVHLG